MLVVTPRKVLETLNASQEGKMRISVGFSAPPPTHPSPLLRDVHGTWKCKKMMRLAVGYTPPHLTFPVHSQCFLGFTGHAIPLALRILRCMFPYICLSRVFSLVYTVRLLCVPSFSSKCALLIAHFLTLSSSTVNNWWFPVGAIHSQQVFFLGLTYPLQLALWCLIYPPCVSFPVHSAIHPNVTGRYPWYSCSPRNSSVTIQLVLPRAQLGVNGIGYDNICLKAIGF